MAGVGISTEGPVWGLGGETARLPDYDRPRILSRTALPMSLQS